MKDESQRALMDEVQETLDASGDCHPKCESPVQPHPTPCWGKTDLTKTPWTDFTTELVSSETLSEFGRDKPIIINIYNTGYKTTEADT